MLNVLVHMVFCEQCGSKVATGSLFCEECGSPVDVYESNEAYNSKGIFDIFSLEKLKELWSDISTQFKHCEYGFIVTRENALISQLNCSSVDLRNKISDYIEKSESRGIKYIYVNLDTIPQYDNSDENNSVKIVEAFRKILDYARPKYLFLLGNEKIIDVVRWENKACDQDADVFGDFAYSVLDTVSPWNGQSYNFEKAIRVGRLPSYNGQTLKSFSSYFETVNEHLASSKVQAYGLSAFTWKDESNYEFKNVSNKPVDTSPNIDENLVSSRIPIDSNLLFFNLHGSDNTKFWYGQDDDNYPSAFSPEILRERAFPYILGVEACYGARYIGLTPNESILLTAMQNKCLAFLGSSKIAFGTSAPMGSCADIVIGDFIKYMAQGYSASDAHILGLKRLMNGQHITDAEIKTLAEFSLYGDPSIKIVRNSSIPKSSEMGKGINIVMPNIRNAISMALTQVDSKIESIIDDYVLKNDILQGELGSFHSKIFKMCNSNLYQKVYSKTGIIDQTVKVYFDSNGSVQKVLISK